MKKPKLLIVTDAYHHRHRFRLHNFLPQFAEVFDLRIIDIASPMYDWTVGSIVRHSHNRYFRNAMGGLINAKRIEYGELLISRQLLPGELTRLINYPFVKYLINKSRDFDIILTTPYIPCTLTLLARPNIPIVYEDVDRFYLFFKNPFKRIVVRFLEEFCITHSDYLIAVSPKLYEEDFTKRGRNVFYIPNGVNIEHFSWAAKSQAKDRLDKRTLIYIGAVETWSGLDLAIKSLAQAVKIDPKLRLVIVGEGNLHYMKNLRRLAKSLGVTDNIHFLGRRNYDDIPRLLAHACLGLATFPKTELMERAFPYKVLEYGAAGLPILMTNVTPFSDLVRKYGAGIVVNRPNPVALSESFLDLLSDELKWVHASLNAQKLAEKYDIKKLAYHEAMLLKEVVMH